MVPASVPSTNLPGATGVPSNNLPGQSGPADVPATFLASLTKSCANARNGDPPMTFDQGALDHGLILLASSTGSLGEALALRETMSGEGNLNMINMDEMD